MTLEWGREGGKVASSGVLLCLPRLGASRGWMERGGEGDEVAKRRLAPLSDVLPTARDARDRCAGCWRSSVARRRPLDLGASLSPFSNAAACPLSPPGGLSTGRRQLFTRWWSYLLVTCGTRSGIKLQAGRTWRGVIVVRGYKCDWVVFRPLRFLLHCCARQTHRDKTVTQ